jgi:hypothetical protein
MNQALNELILAIHATSIHAVAVDLMTSIPAAPLIQTVHLLGIAAVMGSVVLIDLNVLGVALRSQDTTQLVRRLMPWTWWAIPVLAGSGLISVIARPERYLHNPVFGLKFALLAPAVLLAVLFQGTTVRDGRFWERTWGRRAVARVIAALSLILWMGVAMAGRWIAYADFLFPS